MLWFVLSSSSFFPRHHVGHWPTFLVVFSLLSLFVSVYGSMASAVD